MAKPASGNEPLDLELFKLTFETNLFGRSARAGCRRISEARTAGGAAPMTAAQGAQIVVEMACLPDDGPSSRFVDRDGPVPW